MDNRPYISAKIWCRALGLTLGVHLFLFASPNALFGQDNNKLPAEQVEILKQFDAKLAEVGKLQPFPRIPEMDTLPQTLSIKPATFSVSLPRRVPDIRSMMLLPEKGPESSRGYLWLAGGAPRRLDLGGTYTFGAVGKYQITLSGRHEEATSQHLPYQQWRHQEINGNSVYFLNDRWTADLDLGYDRRVNFIYGHPEADTLNAAALRRKVGQFFLAAGARYQDAEKGEWFYGRLELGTLLDSYATSESQTILRTRYARRIANNHEIGGSLLVDATHLRDTLTRKLNNFLLEPEYVYHDARLKIQAGLRIFNHRDQFSFLPDLRLVYALAGSQWQVEAGWQGSLEKNGYRQLFAYNPFIQSRLDSLGNSRKIDLYAGIKGKRNDIEYRVRAGFQVIEDWSLFQFVYSGQDRGFFQVVYDDIRMPYIQAYISVPIYSTLGLEAYWNAYFYAADKEEKAWHRPSFQAYLKSKWTPEQWPLSVSAMCWVEGGISYQDEGGNTKSLTPIIDLSLEGTYRITNRFSAFVQVRNLPGQRWSRWVNYPSFSANLLAGVSYRFP